jgi:hypothetical protein
MLVMRTLAIGVALAGFAAAAAGSASADDRLSGDYAFTDGPTTNTWSITTQCSPEGLCAGTVSGSTGLLVQIRKAVGGPWTVERHDVPNGWTCADGSTGAADVVYTFDPVTLAGTLSRTSIPGVCGDPNPLHAENPVVLTPL